MQLIRGIQAKDLEAIKDGSYEYEKAAVYYGYNTYQHDVEYINQIAEAVKFEHPEVKRSDMRMHHFIKYHSAHYDHIFIQFLLPVEQIKAHLSDYTKL